MKYNAANTSISNNTLPHTPQAARSPSHIIPTINLSPAKQAIAKVAIALYDYVPNEEGELAIKEGEKMIVLNDSDEDWWFVKLVSRKGGEGLVPKTYVELQTPKLDSDTSHESPAFAKSQTEKKNREDEERKVQELEIQHEAQRRQQDAEERQTQLRIEQQRKRDEDKRQDDAKKKVAENAARPPIIPNRPPAVVVFML